MATDAWQQARDGVVALWQRVHPDRAADVERDLTRLHTLVGDGQGSSDVTEAMVQVWQTRLRDLLLADAALTTELMDRLVRLADEIGTRGTDGQVVDTQHMEAHASDGGRVYQAGRDMNITEH